eukprot:tig00020930_g16027.t1
MSANRNRAPLAPVNRCSPIPSPARNSPYPCKNASNSKGRDREWLPVKTDFVIRCTFEDETTRVMSPVQKARSKQAKRNMFKTEFCRLPVFEELTSSSGSEGHGLESEHERAYDHDEELEHFVPSSPCPSSPCPDFGFGAPSPCFEFYAGHAARPDHFQL